MQEHLCRAECTATDPSPRFPPRQDTNPPEVGVVTHRSGRSSGFARTFSQKRICGADFRGDVQLSQSKNIGTIVLRVKHTNLAIHKNRSIRAGARARLGGCPGSQDSPNLTDMFSPNSNYCFVRSRRRAQHAGGSCLSGGLRLEHRSWKQAGGPACTARTRASGGRDSLIWV